MAAAVSSSLLWRGFFSNVFNPKSILLFRLFPGSFSMIREGPGCVSGRAAGSNLHRDCNLYPCEYRVASGPAEIAADRGVPPKINSADTFSCPGAGRCLARLVDAPDMTGLLSD